MTAQQISDTDCYAAPSFSLSTDGGKSWSNMQQIPSFALRKLDNGMLENAADIRPFPLGNGECLVLGCSDYYSEKGNIFWAEPENISRIPSRKAVYAIRHQDGSWSARGEFELPFDTPDVRACCTQIEILSENRLLIPISFESDKCIFSGRSSGKFSVTVLLMKRNGDKLEFIKKGNILDNDVGRGMCEPSLTRLADQRFALTLRAEDGCGYCSVSDDGLYWQPPRPWCWQDDTKLHMSSTQQHWLRVGEKIYLVYTRNDGSNDRVFRFRAPLYMAEADPDRAILFRETEQVVFPRRKCGEQEIQYGNFHVSVISDDRAVITDAALLSADKTTTLYAATVTA